MGAPCPPPPQVEDKLEEQEPGRRHLSGFYVQRGRDVVAGGKCRPFIVLATEIIKAATNIHNTRFHVQRPNVGSVNSMTLQEMQERGYRRIGEAEAQPLWAFWFDYTHEGCVHGEPPTAVPAASTRGRGAFHGSTAACAAAPAASCSLAPSALQVTTAGSARLAASASTARASTPCT